MEETQNVFMTVSKFVNTINESYKGIKYATIYFEVEDCFKNQYNNTCCKPIFILLDQNKKKIVIKHKQIFDKFGGELVISFTENGSRKLPTNNSLLCALVVDFVEKEYNSNKYFSSIIKTVQDEKNIEKIRNQAEKKKLIDDTEIPDF